MNIKEYFTKDMKILVALIIASGIVLTVTVVMMKNNSISYFSACLFVTSFIVFFTLIGALFSYILDIKERNR